MKQKMSEVVREKKYCHEVDDGKNAKERNGFRSKQFIPRNSLLTDLFQINHIQTIYNIFIVMFIVLFSNTIIHDFIETGQIHYGLRTVTYSFGKFYNVIQIWLLMTFLTIVLYTGFFIWSHIRKYFKLSLIRFIDYGFLLLFITYQVFFIILPAILLIEENFPPASSLILLMEQIRMVMKTHAFVRSNAPRVLKQKLIKEDDKNSNCPAFSKFLYFMFAPTLIYRDEYPRTKQINWKNALWSFAEVGIIIFHMAFMFERFIIPPFEKYRLEIFKPQITILTLFNSMIPAMIIYLFGFYCVLHSWQNGVAELLRFADKLFYKDWWNCSNYSVFYRNWNIIVQDWLYNYIYQDVYAKFHSKVISIVTVFIISAVFHEYIMALAFRFFYPVLLLMFGGLGLLLVFVTKTFSKSSGNILMWLSLFMGNGILITLYSMEYYARLNCPPYDNKLFDFLLPRSWICYDITSKI